MIMTGSISNNMSICPQRMYYTNFYAAGGEYLLFQILKLLLNLRNLCQIDKTFSLDSTLACWSVSFLSCPPRRVSACRTWTPRPPAARIPWLVKMSLFSAPWTSSSSPWSLASSFTASCPARSPSPSPNSRRSTHREYPSLCALDCDVKSK